MTTETTGTVEEQQETREYGFTLMVGKDGKIVLTPHNLANDFEFLGLAEYIDQKKRDLVNTMALGLEARTLHSVGLVAKLIAQTHQEAQKSEPQAG